MIFSHIQSFMCKIASKAVYHVCNSVQPKPPSSPLQTSVSGPGNALLGTCDLNCILSTLAAVVKIQIYFVGINVCEHKWQTNFASERLPF